MSDTIHGYVKLTITQSEREYLKNWLDTRQNWINSFKVRDEQKGWWIFKYTKPVYRTDEPPSGLYVYSWDKKKYVTTTFPYDELKGVYRLFKHNPSAHISSEWVHAFNLYIRGK